jgi:hypothetical protein
MALIDQQPVQALHQHTVSVLHEYIRGAQPRNAAVSASTPWHTTARCWYKAKGLMVSRYQRAAQTAHAKRPFYLTSHFNNHSSYF